MSFIFQILVEGNDEAPHDWKYNWENSELIPEGAFKCTDEGIDNCYLGLSLYGDGVCDEGIGNIDASERIHIFPTHQEKAKCPFYLYLVEGGKEDKKDKKDEDN